MIVAETARTASHKGPVPPRLQWRTAMAHSEQTVGRSLADMYQVTLDSETER